VQALLRVSKTIDTITQGVGVVAYWLVPLMVLVGVYNVFGRFVGQYIGTNLTTNALIEGQWYLFSLVFWLGAPYALLHNEHVRVDVLYARKGSRYKAIVNLLGTLLILIPFCSLLIYFSWNFIAVSWDILEGSPDPSGLPRYPIKTLIAVGAGLLILQGISEVIKNGANLMRLSRGETLEADEEEPGSPTAADAPAAGVLSEAAESRDAEMETIQPESADTPDDKPSEPTAPEHKQEKQQ
jgi:TRAP-type mannitol/chloroaromatic compound transport system permease small subunit